jgi:hypothetical protein
VRRNAGARAAQLLLGGLITIPALCSADDMLAKIQACAAQAVDVRRLACYDSAIGRVPPGQPAQEAPIRPGTSPVERDFGMSPQVARQQGQAPPDKLGKLVAHVVSVTRQLRGEAVVTLDNGQVWQEAEGGSVLDVKPGDAVTIYAGVLGSFLMSSPQTSSRRVKRLR